MVRTGQPTTTLPRGRHAGQPLETILRPYLQWLLAFDVESHELRQAIRDELNRGER